MELDDTSRVAIVGGGPAGSFTSYFLLEIADRVDLDIGLDIFESKDFSRFGPPGCNHCGGIVSESLVQMLATEGIVLPSSVVQRGIEGYMLHSDEVTVRIDTPLHEKRIAAVYRGGGPKGAKNVTWESFDAYLLNLARKKGANLVRAKVQKIGRKDGRPVITAGGESFGPYDLLVGAVGVNTKSLELFDDLGLDYGRPQTTRAFIGELHLGRKLVNEVLGDCMNVFLQDIPRLEFAALIPKGEYATMCLVGHQIDRALVEAFLQSREVRRLFPPEIGLPDRVCNCRPLMNIGGGDRPFGDRVVLVGDCGVTRLYKDGIGAAYRTAKSLAVTAIFSGVSRRDFRKFYWPMCRALANDNLVGKFIFCFLTLIRKWTPLRRGVLAMVVKEQAKVGEKRAMSMVMWDTFTGSAPYRDILLRTLSPLFLGRLCKGVVRAFFSSLVR